MGILPPTVHMALITAPTCGRAGMDGGIHSGSTDTTITMVLTIPISGDGIRMGQEADPLTGRSSQKDSSPKGQAGQYQRGESSRAPAALSAPVAHERPYLDPAPVDHRHLARERQFPDPAPADRRHPVRVHPLPVEKRPRESKSNRSSS